MTKTIIGIVVVVLVVSAGWWFGRGAAVAPTSNDSIEINNIEQATVTIPDGTTNSQPVASENIKISGNEFSYAPAVISAKVGQSVTVTYTNTGKYPHNFVIDELGLISKTIKAGETDTFSFVPNKVGTFSFYCSLPNHREKGMVGQLLVN